MALGRSPAGVSSYGIILEEIKGINGRILDLACGDGYLLSAMKTSGNDSANLHGVDMSDGELAIARKNLPDVHIRKGNARALDFPENYFDAVTCHMALMLMPNVHEVVSEIARVLKPGRIFVAITGGAYIKTSVCDLYIEKLDELLSKEGKNFLKGLGDKRVSSQEGVTGLFSLEAGFSSVSFEEEKLEYDVPPENMVDLYMESYDPFLLSRKSQDELREFLLRSFSEMADARGRLRNTKSFRKIVAAKTT